MALHGTVSLAPIIRAAQLRPGDFFETLITGAAGIRKQNRANGSSIGVPVELWYTDGRDVSTSLHPGVRVRLVERARVN